MPPKTSNRKMNDALRAGRDELSAYMYKGKADDGAGMGTDAELLEPVPDAETPADDALEAPPTDAPDAGLTILEPGEPDPEDSYTYAPSDTDGAVTVYPPGIPCDTSTTRVALDHPASAAEMLDIQDALAGSDGSVMGKASPDEAMAEVY